MVFVFRLDKLVNIFFFSFFVFSKYFNKVGSSLAPLYLFKMNHSKGDSNSINSLTILIIFGILGFI